jgi:hypothetical protein
MGVAGCARLRFHPWGLLRGSGPGAPGQKPPFHDDHLFIMIIIFIMIIYPSS